MSPELQPMAAQYTGHVISVCITWQRYSTAIDWSSGDAIRTISNHFINYIYLKCKSINKKYSRSKPEILRLLWDIIVFRLVAYLLNMICLILQLLYKIAYVWIFVYNLTQFDINFSRQEHQIDVLYVSFNAWDSQVSSNTPFHFSFTLPWRKWIILYFWYL